MNPKKIKKFLETLEDYFKKKNEIALAMKELDILLRDANDYLNYTVDNGLNNEYLVKVAKAYAKHKFNSKVVGEFVDKIYSMFFNELEVELKERLEVVSMRLEIDNYCTSFHNKTTTVVGPITINVHDNLTNRFFKLLIPIKNSISTDMAHWFKNGEGMYQVIANAIDSDRSKTICKVFDQAKVCEAVRKYLNGEFDKDLSSYNFQTNHYLNHNKYSPYYIPDYANFADSGYIYDDNNVLKFVDIHNLFNLANDMHDDDVVVGCICDIDEYSAKKESTI